MLPCGFDSYSLRQYICRSGGMVDTPVLETGASGRVGSTPTGGTRTRGEVVEDPTPKDSFEFWFEAILLGALSVVSIILVIKGATACTAYHPCAVWAQIVMIGGGALLGIVGQTLINLVIIPRMLHERRKRK